MTGDRRLPNIRWPGLTGVDEVPTQLLEDRCA